MPTKSSERIIGKQEQDFYPQTDFCEMLRSYPLLPGCYVLDVSGNDRIKFSNLHKRKLQDGMSKGDFCDMLQHFTLERGQYQVNVLPGKDGDSVSIEFGSLKKRWVQSEDLKK